MAAFEVNPKYSGYRIDHPDLRDVMQTTFAKGIITDIYPVESITEPVKSLVKVDLGGGWLPLFYNPKEEFWNTENHQATEFNVPGKYFENAWMSFRKGDEVVVLLQEDVPKAVIGFADGKPRVGENITKCIFETAEMGENYFLWRFFSDGSPETYPEAGLNEEGGVANSWNGEETGPDGKALGLTEPCPLIGTGFHDDSTWQGTYWFEDYFPYTELIPPFTWNGHQKVTLGGYAYYYYREWLIPIGPMMVIVAVLSEYLYVERTDEGWHLNPVTEEWVHDYTNPTESGYSRETIEMLIFRKLFDKEFYDSFESPDENPDFYNNFKSSIDWWLPRDGFEIMSGSLPLIFEYYPPDGWLVDYKFSSWNSNDGDPPVDMPPEWWALRKYLPCWEEAEFYVRPHNP